MKASKLPSGSWRARATKTINGKKITKSFTAKTKSQAEKNAYQWKMQNSSDTSSMTVEQAVAEYINIKRNVLSASTVLGYERYLQNGFNDIKHIQLIDLTSPIIQRSINNQAKTKSVKSLKNYYGLVFSAVRMFRPEFNYNVTFPQDKKPKKHQFSKEYISTLIKAVHDSEMELPVLLALTLSCRASEVAGLKWSDIDFENHTLHIQRAKVASSDGFIIQEKNKNLTSNRLAFIPDLLYNVLVSANKENEFVVKVPQNQFYQRLRRITNKANIKPISFHELRHMTASIMLDIGINNKLAQEIGGWATDNILKSVYQHTFSESRKQANSQLNNYFNDFIN